MKSSVGEALFSSLWKGDTDVENVLSLPETQPNWLAVAMAAPCLSLPSSSLPSSISDSAGGGPGALSHIWASPPILETLSKKKGHAPGVSAQIPAGVDSDDQVLSGKSPDRGAVGGHAQEGGTKDQVHRRS